ncbi:hypothetical protein L1987_17835 [Smallanthus sonchifolius]|uniref:Uncharacterized protein n=1 Tax=Smallanthus sonchifolius TaxID=185202 RepID=A0ACB9IYL6_9ASTR|nr:hypothetical protein L1987_17835 [Smallanthus sonchifolius]
MAPATGFSYQRLRNEGGDEYDYEEEIKRAIDHVKARIRRSSRLQRVHMRKRLKMKIPSLKKFMRRRSRLVMVSMAKVLKRLKDSQSHFGDLFAGNYLFMQVNPTPLKSSSPYAIRASIKRIEDELRHSPRS